MRAGREVAPPFAPGDGLFQCDVKGSRPVSEFALRSTRAVEEFEVRELASSAGKRGRSAAHGAGAQFADLSECRGKPARQRACGRSNSQGTCDTASPFEMRQVFAPEDVALAGPTMTCGKKVAAGCVLCGDQVESATREGG